MRGLIVRRPGYRIVLRVNNKVQGLIYGCKGGGWYVGEQAGSSVWSFEAGGRGIIFIFWWVGGRRLWGIDLNLCYWRGEEREATVVVEATVVLARPQHHLPLLPATVRQPAPHSLVLVLHQWQRPCRWQLQVWCSPQWWARRSRSLLLRPSQIHSPPTPVWHRKLGSFHGLTDGPVWCRVFDQIGGCACGLGTHFLMRRLGTLVLGGRLVAVLGDVAF